MLKRMVLMLALIAWLTPGLARAADPPAPPHSETSTTEVHVAEHGSAHDAAGGEHEKPPLIPDPMKRETQLQALWVVIIFVILLAVLYPTAWKNVLAGLKAREKRIREDIANAEAARTKAEATLRQYNEQLATAEGKIRDMMNKATADAEKVATNLRMQAQTESEEIKQRATREIEAARQQAVADFRMYAAEVSTNIAEKILRRNLNSDDQRELVKESLDQLQTAGKV